MKKFIFLGASRGLGWHTYKQLSELNNANHFLLSSRKIKQVEDQINPQTFLLAQDFSTAVVDSAFYDQLVDFNGDCLVYFAGGGLTGCFSKKNGTIICGH